MSVSLVLLAASLVTGATTTTTPARHPSPHETYETVTVGKGILVFIAPEGRTGTVQGNSVAVVGDDGVLVVDTGQFPQLARRMIADIRKVTDKPVRVVVNTHWHGDHLLGNAEYRRAFPGVAIVNHAETRRLCGKYLGDFAEKAPKELPQYATEMREQLAKGLRKSGAPLSADDKEYLQRQADEIDAFMKQLPDAAYTPADVTFERDLRVHLGQREVQILHLGRANTSGDTVVYVPDAKVVMAGDLVVYPTPYSFGSWLQEWTQTLEKLKALGATALVPGHGPVLRDHEYIDTLIALIEETRRQVQAAVKEGASLDDTRKKVDLGSYRRKLAGDDYWRQRAFDEFYLQPAVGRAYKEARGETMEE
jgi:cyclase